VPVRQHGDGVGADLVRRVTVGGDAVGADHDAVDQALRHERTGAGVGDQAERDPLALELPRGEPRALQERARLVYPDHADLAGRPGGLDDADRRAIPRRGEGARVAVGEHPRALGEEGRAVLAHPEVGLEVLGVNRLRAGEQIPHHRVPSRALRVGEDLVGASQSPAQVHRRRPRAAEQLRNLLEAGGESGGAGVRSNRPHPQHQTVGRGDADRRRAAHRQPADGVGDLLGLGAVDPHLLGRQEGLFEEAQVVVLPADRGKRVSVEA